MVQNKNNKAIWNTRIKKDTSSIFKKIGSSIDVDKRLFKEDILGSIIHAQMLVKQKIIDKVIFFTGLISPYFGLFCNPSIRD